MGGQLIYDVNLAKLTAYNAGVVWEPKDNSFVGLKHESQDKENIKVGKFLFYFFHKASESNTVGAEFGFNWASKVLDGRAGINHKFDDSNNLKVKIDQDGNLGHVFKHQFNKNLTATATTNVQVLDILNGKHGAHPIGIGFDLKY